MYSGGQVTDPVFGIGVGVGVGVGVRGGRIENPIHFGFLQGIENPIGLRPLFPVITGCADLWSAFLVVRRPSSVLCHPSIRSPQLGIREIITAVSIGRRAVFLQS